MTQYVRISVSLIYMLIENGIFIMTTTNKLTHAPKRNVTKQTMKFVFDNEKHILPHWSVVYSSPTFGIIPHSLYIF